ncbi:MAG: hypothetical protein KGL48_08410 [Sphingomonadales bacterium]|nr:hypothetical protein [Sphingomonadales bacterium]MDE2568903.1 hypothetical protein [Sphingomonadales bacterium]
MHRIVASAVVLTSLSGGMAACHEDATRDANTGIAVASPGSAPSDQSDACGANRLADLIGQPDSPALRQNMRQRVGLEPIRWIRPGEAVTQDFVPGRLNVIFGQDNHVRTLRCG